ncbi:MAG: SCP2 sterol-binding domain-containing protein [Legionella sp.]|nr:SCP2 sterol-binding domain-containing protein [Legionella sp.]
MIKDYSLRALQHAINQALALDETTSLKIAALQGKTLEVVVKPLHVNFFMHFTADELQLLASYEGVPDTIIESSPLGLIRLSLLPVSKARSLFNDSIRVSGDIEVGQKVKQLFDEMDIDWEGHLAHFTGDVVAYQVGAFVRKGRAWKQMFKQSFRDNFSEYLQEELRLIPPKEEVNDFLNDVDALVLDVARLEAAYDYLIEKDALKNT